MLQVIQKISYIVIIILFKGKVLYSNNFFFLLMSAFFLNPMFQYSKQFSHHSEIKIGLKEVIKRLELDLDKQAKSLNEV